MPLTCSFAAGQTGPNSPDRPRMWAKSGPPGRDTANIVAVKRSRLSKDVVGPDAPPGHMYLPRCQGSP